MNALFWRERLGRCPALRPWLKRAARYAVAGERLPATLTLGDIPQDKAVRLALEDLFPGCREQNGRLKARLTDAMREPELWLPLAELLGLRPARPETGEPPDELFAQTLRRLKVLHPDDTALIAYSEFNLPDADGKPCKGIRVRTITTQRSDQ